MRLSHSQYYLLYYLQDYLLKGNGSFASNAWQCIGQVHWPKWQLESTHSKYVSCSSQKIAKSWMHKPTSISLPYPHDMGAHIPGCGHPYPGYGHHRICVCRTSCEYPIHIRDMGPPTSYSLTRIWDYFLMHILGMRCPYPMGYFAQHCSP